MKTMVHTHPTVRVLNDERALEALRPEWNGLLQRSRADSIFLTWEWICTWWRHFGTGRRLHILEVRRGNQLLGIAPLHTTGHALEFIGSGEAGADYLDLILSSDSETEAIETLAAHFENNGVCIRFRQFLQNSNAARLAALLQNRSFLLCERQVYVCPYLQLSCGSWDDFLSGLGASHRANVRRRLRAFESRGTVEWAIDEGSRRSHLAALIDLHNRRWIQRGGSDAFHKPALVAFHEDFTRLALQAGWLRLFVLRVDGRNAAAVYGLSRNGRACFYQGGLAPEYERMSLGMVALGLSIRHALEEGAFDYDLLHGDEPYKALWTKKARHLWACELYPNSLRGTLSMHFDRSLRKTRRMARYVISKVQPSHGLRQGH